MICSDNSGMFTERLLLYAQGQLDEASGKEIGEHLELCKYCRMKLALLLKFLLLAIRVDKSAWGDNPECPALDELIMMAEGSSEIASDRINELADHQKECIKCNDVVEIYAALNKYIAPADFELQSVEFRPPKELDSRLKRTVRDHIRSGALKKHS